MIAVCFILGTNFPTLEPELSALRRCILLPPAIGIIAIIKTITPIPPIQWEKLRHISIHFDKSSTLVKIDAPVVVNPDTISKTASTIFGISPLTTKGIAPTILIIIQLRDTTTKPSLA